MKLFVVVGLVLAGCVSTAIAGPTETAVKRISAEDIFRSPEIVQPRVAPDGKHVAFLMPIEKRLSVMLFDLSNGSLTPLARAYDGDFTQLFWKGSDRIIFSGDPNGSESRSLFMVDIHTKKITTLAEVYLERMRPGAAVASVIDPLDLDPNHMLILGTDSRGGGDYGLYYLNLATQERSHLSDKIDDTFNWGVDCDGDVRTHKRFEKDRTFYEVTADKRSAWRKIGEVGHGVGLSYDSIQFMGFNADNRHVYTIKTEKDGRESVYALDTQTLDWGAPIFTSPHGAISWVKLSPDHRAVLGIGYNEGLEAKWLDPHIAQVATTLEASLPKGTVKTISSFDDSAKVFTVAVRGDTHPTDFYLLDLRGRPQLALLGRSNPHVDPANLQPMKEVTYKARDGLLIHAFLTLPRGASTAHKVPLVLNPHGGPYGIYDKWEYNPEVQFLANRGYAVLQPNYRGSGGYGLDFIKAGQHEWGRKMQDDLTDAVKWAIDQGWADPARVCIYGASYGGYAALAGLTFTPELYCCGVNYVGVSDLSLIANWEHERGEAGKSFYKDMIGDDREFLRERSPVNFVERIRVPTLHAYGENDPRVDIKNWTELEHELKKYGKTYEAIHENDEGHGFHHEEAKIGFYEHLDAFLAKYLAPEHPGHVEIKDPKVIEMPAR